MCDPSESQASRAFLNCASRVDPCSRRYLLPKAFLAAVVGPLTALAWYTTYWILHAARVSHPSVQWSLAYERAAVYERM